MHEKFDYLLKIENEKKSQEDILAEQFGRIMSGDSDRNKLSQKNKD